MISSYLKTRTVLQKNGQSKVRKHWFQSCKEMALIQTKWTETSKYNDGKKNDYQTPDFVASTETYKVSLTRVYDNVNFVYFILYMPRCDMYSSVVCV